GTRMAPCSHVSRFGRSERWIGGEGSYGSTGMWVRSTESWKYLVSHQPACCDGLCTIAKTGPERTAFVSCRQFRNRLGLAPFGVHHGGLALRRDAPDVRAAPDCARRTDRARALVRADLQDARPAQSGPRKSHRLVLVCGFPNCLWRGRRLDRGAPVPQFYPRKIAVSLAGGVGGAR